LGETLGKKTFRGGAHPPEHKELTEGLAIVELPAPAQVVVPLLQHLGAVAKPIVEKGQEVLIGQRLGEAAGYVSVPCHASVSGKVVSVGPMPHPFGRPAEAVVIDSDGEDRWMEGIGEEEPVDNLSVEEILNRVRDGGLAGMGGAAFPTHVKLNPPKEKPIDTAILNGAECEPFLTSDHRLMLEKTEDIVNGFRLIVKVLGARRGYIGVEANKPDAAKKMAEATKNDPNIKVFVLQVKYPQGAEKQLIWALTRREVPSGGLPMDCGCLVQNVGTAKAMWDAVARRKPLIDRVVTVTGPAVREPGNFLARIGAPFSQLIEAAGGIDHGGKVIMGGPMMGLAQPTLDLPVIKGTSGIMVLDEAVSKIPDPQPCILCGRCVDICPMKLVPTRLATLAEYDMLEEADRLGILDCMECGTCTYVCPSNRNLVHWIKFGKLGVMEARKKAKATA
jgi:electron transport complex protein RnfC